MRSRSVLVISVLVGLFATTAAIGQTKVDVSSVKWLAGCWEMKSEKSGSVTIEQWTTGEGGTLFGLGRTLKGGKLVSWEFMRIAQDGEAAKFYAQLPGAEKATAFALKTATKDEMVFENLENDFPHRVIYRNAGTDKLAARIEGTMGGKSRGIDFSFMRIKCS